MSAEKSWRASHDKHSARAQWLKSIRSLKKRSTINPTYQAWLEYQKLQSADQETERLNEEGQRTRAVFDWRALGPLRIETGEDSWNKIGGHGRINLLAFHPKDPRTLYAGSAAGGLWKSTDGGGSWQWIARDHPLLLSISGIAIDPEDGNTLYVLTGDGNGSLTVAPSLPSVGVMKSTDGGLTWHLTGLAWRNGHQDFGYDLQIDPRHKNVLFAATNHGLYRTGDGGVSWQMVTPGFTRSFVFHPEKSKVAYAATTDEIYVSNDHGLTFEKADFNPNWLSTKRARLRQIALAVTPKAPGLLYALVAEPTGFTGLFLSRDEGQSFQQISAKKPNILGFDCTGDDASSLSWYALSLAVSPADEREIWVGSVNIWKSQDGGRTWDIRGYYDNCETLPCDQDGNKKCQGLPFIHADNHALYVRPAHSPNGVDRCSSKSGEKNGYEIWSANDGGVFKSLDDGRSWCDVSSGLRITQAYRLCGAPGDPGVYYGAQDNGTNYLLGGVAKVVYRGDGAECVVDDTDRNNVYASRDGGNKVGWFFRKEGRSDSVTLIRKKLESKSPWITPIEMHPTKSNRLYTCYADVYDSEQRNGHWRNLTSGALGKDQCTQIVLAKSQPEVIYVSKKRAVYVSHDSGRTWPVKSTGWPKKGAPITNIAVDDADSQRAWVSLGGYLPGQKIYRTRNGGASWENLSAGLPNVPIYVVLHDSINPDHRLYVGTDIGVFYQDSVCEIGTDCHWVHMDGLPPFFVMDLRVDKGKIQAATFGQGIWESPMTPIAGGSN